MELPARQAHRDPPELTELQAHQAHRDPPELMERPAHRAHRDQLGRQVLSTLYDQAAQVELLLRQLVVQVIRPQVAAIT